MTISSSLTTTIEFPCANKTLVNLFSTNNFLSESEGFSGILNKNSVQYPNSSPSISAPAIAAFSVTVAIDFSITLPFIACSKPSNIFNKPVPPESTTPTSFKTGSNSGVLFNEARASFKKTSKHFSIVQDSSTFSAKKSAASRITVKIVPSTGFITALYATSFPDTNASAKSTGPILSFPSNEIANPLKIWDKITPEFPLAPISNPLEKALAIP